MVFISEAGQFGILQVKEKCLILGEIKEELIELYLNRRDGWMKSVIAIIVLVLGLSFSITGNSKEVVDRELVAKILLLGESLGSSTGGNRYPGSIMIAIRYNNMLYTCFVQNDSGTVRFTCDDPYE